MREPRSYIVRIYRQGYATLSGIVEDTHTGSKQSFRNTRELSAVLRAPIVNASPVGHKRKPPSTNK
jgi:hypothetical protein